MPSRMERYYQASNNEQDTNSRSRINGDLYNRIYEDPEYSNMEIIADVERTNEIDITKIKEILKNREDYRRDKELRQIVKRPEEIIIKDIEEEEDKVYDIRDILSRAKVERSEDDYHSLKNADFNFNSSIKQRAEEFKKEEEELKILLDTITNTSMLNKLEDKDLSLKVLDLEPSGNTIVASTESVRKLLEEQEQPKEEPQVLDKSFYTSSLNFDNEDFEELKSMNSNLKTNNSLIKILIFILSVIITVATIYIVYSLIK